MTWPARILPTCEEMSGLISRSMDHTLPWHLRLRMRWHLRACLLCRRYRRQLSLLRTLLRTHGWRLTGSDEAQQPGLPPEAKARIQRAIDNWQS